jgi:hypothetical protein
LPRTAAQEQAEIFKGALNKMKKLCQKCLIFWKTGFYRNFSLIAEPKSRLLWKSLFS